MIHEKPSFTCDGCERPLGLNLRPLEKIMDDEHMSQFPLHFCNNNCRDVYQKEYTFDKSIYWISADWPNNKQVSAG